MPETEKEFPPPYLAELYQELVSIKPAPGAVSVQAPGRENLRKWQEGTPLLELKEPELDINNFFAVMEQVKDILKKYQPGCAGELEQAHASVAEKSWRASDLIKIILPVEDWTTLTGEAEANPEATAFLVTHSLRPFLREYARLVCHHLDLGQWARGTCPVCGNNPAVARLSRVKGRRYLCCSQCNTEWPYSRAGCPYCSNSEEKARFFTVEGYSAYRVYFCDQCRRFLKTLDEKKCGEKTEMFWEDINTVELDFIAAQEGFIKGSGLFN